MEHENRYSLIITACSDRDTAKAVARQLVQRRLAACVQLFPVESVYCWQGEICDEPETLLLIKSRGALFDEIAAAIREIHPYEVPEIIRIPITGGLPEYLQWIDEVTGAKPLESPGERQA